MIITFEMIMIAFVSCLILLSLFYLLIRWLDKIKLRRLQKKYNEKEDKSRKGEELADRGSTKRGSGRKRRRTNRSSDKGTALIFDKTIMSSGGIGLSSLGKVGGDKSKPRVDIQVFKTSGRTRKRKKRDLKRRRRF